MLWVIIAAGMCAPIAIRLATLRERPEVWWLSFTIALAGIVLGSALLADEAAVNETLGVHNVAYLLSDLAYVTAGGSVTIYVHTLRRDRPSRAVMSAHAATGVLIGAVMTLGWLAAPVHQVAYRRFRDIPPPYPQVVAYEWLFHLYFLVVLANVAACCSSLARRTPVDDPARRLGLVVIAVSTSLDIAAHLLYLTRLALQPRIGTSALELATAADGVTVVAVLGIAAGTVAFLVVPQLLAHLRTRHLITQLRPLWLRTRELYPSVALPSPRLVQRRPALQAERMIIEITDGLRLVALPADRTAGADPYDVLADTFRRPHGVANGGVLASAVLPIPTTRREEEEQVLELARRYDTGVARYAS